VNRLYDYADPDEERRPWNDQTIIPRSIKGKKTTKKPANHGTGSPYLTDNDENGF